MNAQLEGMTDLRILNLSTVSSGVLVNQLVLDYFLAKHRVQKVLYILDSGVFFSSRWNEGRLNDPRLYARAPFDPDLAARLIWNPVTVRQGLNYAVGFSKINNSDRLRLDVSDDEVSKFDRSYVRSTQIDTLRFRAFYPDAADHGVFLRYLSTFEAMIERLEQRGITVVAVKPPVSETWYGMLPDEAWSDEVFQAMLRRHEVPFYDFSLAMPDDALFYDADHLNRSGVLRFFEEYLARVMLTQTARPIEVCWTACGQAF
jgi:hypothetical protein